MLARKAGDPQVSRVALCKHSVACVVPSQRSLAHMEPRGSCVISPRKSPALLGDFPSEGLETPIRAEAISCGHPPLNPVFSLCRICGLREPYTQLHINYLGF